MAITQEQRERRRRYIGSSDIASVMNMNPWRSASDLWLIKTGRADDGHQNDATEAGTFLEPSVLDWAESKLQASFQRDAFFAAGNRCANLDAFWRDGKQTHIIEAKTSGVVGRIDAGYGEGDDQLPDYVLLQGHHQAGVTGFTHIYVPVLLGGVGFRMYSFDANPEVVAAVIEAAETFWEKHVKRDIPPENFKPSHEILRRMRRQPGKVVEIPDFLGEEFEEARRKRIEAEKLEKEVEHKVLGAMNDGDGISYAGKVIEYREMKRDGYVVEPYSYRQWMFPRAKKQKKQEAVTA